MAVAKFASKSDTRPELAGVFITKDKVVATDGFRLVEVSVPKTANVAEYPKTNGKSAMQGVKPFIVPAKEFGKIKLPNNKNVPILNNLAISYADNQRVDFITTDLENVQVKTLKRIDAKYPDYEQIFPKGEVKAEVSVNGEYLAEVCETLAELSNLKDIKIKFYGDNMPLVIEAGNTEIQSARAMIMPLRK